MYYRYEGGDSQLQDQLQHEISPSNINSDITPSPSFVISGNYTVTAHDIVDGTIITNSSVVYPHVLEYILLLPSPTETINIISKYYIVLVALFYNNVLGITSIILLPSHTKTVIPISKSSLYCLFYNYTTSISY